MDVEAHPRGPSNPNDRWQQPADLANKDLDQTIANYNSYSTYRMLNSYRHTRQVKRRGGHGRR